jgi:hypothetical protein
VLLGLEGGLKAREKIIEGLEFVVGSFQAEALVKAAGGDPAGAWAAEIC